MNQDQIEKRIGLYAAEHPDVAAKVLAIVKDERVMALVEQLKQLAIKAAPTLAQIIDESGVDVVPLAVLCVAADAFAPTEAEIAATKATVASIFEALHHPESILGIPKED